MSPIGQSAPVVLCRLAVSDKEHSHGLTATKYSEHDETIQEDILIVWSVTLC